MVVDEDESDTLELVSFAVGGQEYAFPIDRVQEIVQAPESVRHVPSADDRLLGMIDLRGRLLPVVSMRRMVGLPVAGPRPPNRIVVVSLPGRGAVGVVMDTVREVLRVPRRLVAPPPPLPAGDGRPGEIDAVCRLDDGDRLVSVLSVDRMFAQVAGQPGGEEPGAEQPSAGEPARTTENPDDEEMFVVFRLAGAEYAVDVDAVQEIIRVPDVLIRVPRTSDFVEGLVNLRGTVLPVVDLRTRLGLPRTASDDRRRIVVLTRGSVRTGFVVDAVAEVARVGRHLLEPAPELTAGQARMVSRVANLAAQQRLLLLVELDQLLAVPETRALDEALASI
ncbi:chemotaxis protein CheW [Paractinoplanes durhamensis]|uniref:Chemotaxis protein CheW n=1 Tax=Paractinoplanes durhamensis TaxID=113563 RepID=A0ABQ3YMM5_9ACTN|nr:chemotaxis protein CheW [Actinoplanes durhamensis]GID98748.1 hypothetical protein Adu01nite_00990 [Actinoplanes durhamensis]